ncbi:MAG: lipid-A-disaccharide synthase [bacterium]
MHKNILISVGEPSGDMHAADLVQAVKKIVPNTKFYGMGGNLMRDAGVDIIIDAGELSIFGGLEIITKLSKIRQAFRIMQDALLRNKPDLLILVDYPGFNLRLAEFAKEAGVKILYYISPKIWAWNQGRIEIIKKYVDIMAVIFPFEVDFYKKLGMPVIFVGNPLLKTVKPKLTHDAARQSFHLDPNCKTIGLFPGSRKSEIKYLLPIMLIAAKLLKNQNPNLQFLLPQANSITLDDLQPYLQSSPVKIRIIKDQNYDVMQVCDAIIAASGTATLEIALMAIPQVIIYKKSWLEYQIARHLIKIPYVGLCNILANKKIVQEFLQYDATPNNIAKEIEKILNDANYREEMIANLIQTKKLLESDKQKNIAELVLKTI